LIFSSFSKLHCPICACTFCCAFICRPVLGHFHALNMGRRGSSRARSL